MWGSADARKLANQAIQLWQQHRIAEAIQLYTRGYQDALRRQHPLAAYWFLVGRGGCYFSSGSYRQALDDYLNARDTALKAGLLPEAATVLSNLSSLYFHIFDTSSALAAAEQARELMPRDLNPAMRSQIVVQLGRVLLIRGEQARAQALFQEAIQMAAKGKDRRTEALAWDQMGAELMRSGNLDPAEAALNNALRLRQLQHDPNVYATKYQLGVIALKRGNTKVARHWIEAAFATPNRDSLQIPDHHFYWARAEILRAEGDLTGSLDEFLRAANAADEWRTRGLSADRFRISADSLMHEIYDGAVDTAMALYRQSGDKRYAVLSWQLDERIRAASLRESLKQGHGWTARVSSEYWPMLDRLRSLDTDRFSAPNSSSDSGEAVRLRMQLAEMEARAVALEPRPLQAASHPTPVASDRGPQNFEKYPERLFPGISLNHVQKVLGKSRTLISFHLGTRASYRWVITGDRFEVATLGALQKDYVASVQGALREDGPKAVPLLEKVYSDLFSDIRLGGSDRWAIALDGDLFDLPVSGLVCARNGNRPVYLMERRAIELVPGAWALGSRAGVSNSGRFVGVGDGVYNMADNRYRQQDSGDKGWKGSFPTLLAASPDPMQLPRLAASRKEIEECARRAGGASTLLLGPDATREKLLAALAGQPAIIHIAAHFLTEHGGGNTAITLGMKPDPAGNPKWELLTADDIRSLQVPGSIVVMSGCSSATGPVVPAAGLLGLARAWLEAGATAVIATEWPVPDDSGEFFSKFYDYLRDSSHADKLAPAEALRRAQVDMLRSSTLRAEPRYWAAYQIFVRSN